MVKDIMVTLKRSVFAALVLFSITGSGPAFAQDVTACDYEKVTDFDLIEQMITTLDQGNYQNLASLMDIDRKWSEADKASVAANIRDALQGSELVSCTLLQAKSYSDEFKVEIILLQFESTNLHIFSAAVLRNGDWEIIRLQFETDFNVIFGYLN